LKAIPLARHPWTTLVCHRTFGAPFGCRRCRSATSVLISEPPGHPLSG